MEDFNGKITKEPFNFFSTNWKQNIVQDLEARELYSRKAIYFFSCFFSVIVGGFLMATNLKKINKKDGIWIVMVYSISYTIIQIIILSHFERNNILTMCFSMFGSFALYNTFWKKFVGIETKYRTKSIWVPLIVCLSISTLIIALIIIADKQ